VADLPCLNCIVQPACKAKITTYAKYIHVTENCPMVKEYVKDDSERETDVLKYFIGNKVKELLGMDVYNRWEKR